MKLSPLVGAAAAIMLYVAPSMAADVPAAFAPCKACHKIEAGAKMVGPSLFGVYGKKAASVEGFAYSENMKKADWVWDDAHLTTWLADPKAMVAGTKMAFPGVKKPEDIKTLIDFLKTLK
jgi:cytochrome c